MPSAIHYDAGAFLAQLGALKRQLPQTIKAVALASAVYGAKVAVETKFIEANPPYLNRKTGHASRSVAASPKAALLDQFRARGTYGSNIWYVKRHEEGGTYSEKVPAHRVKAHWRRLPESQQRASYHGRGRKRSAYRIRTQTRVKEHLVRGYFVSRKYRARHMFRDTQGFIRQYIPSLTARGVELLAATNQAPSAAEVLAAAGLPG